MPCFTFCRTVADSQSDRNLAKNASNVSAGVHLRNGPVKVKDTHLMNNQPIAEILCGDWCSSRHRLDCFRPVLHCTGDNRRMPVTVASSYKMASIRVCCIWGTVQRVPGSIATRIIIRYDRMYNQHVDFFVSGWKYVLNEQKTAWWELINRVQPHDFVEATDECRNLLWTQL